MECVCGFRHGERVKFVHEFISEEGNHRMLSYLKKCMTKVKESTGLASLNLRLDRLEEILSRLERHAENTDRDAYWEIICDNHEFVEELLMEDMEVDVEDIEFVPDPREELILRVDGPVIDIEPELPDVVQNDNLPDLIPDNDGEHQEN